MKAFVGLCGPLECGLLAFCGLRHLHSSCFLYQEQNTKGAFMPFIINVGVLALVGTHCQYTRARRHTAQESTIRNHPKPLAGIQIP